MRPDFPLIDADNHYYETRDAFTRHMPARFAHLAVRVVGTGDDERIMVGDTPFTFLRHNYDRVVKPGALRELLRSMKKGTRAGGESDADEPIRAPYVERDARLTAMDAQGVEACVLYPTLAVCVEHFMKDDPVQLYANFESFNRWLDDQWGYAHANRIYAAPLLSLRDVDRACAELDRVLALGARVISLRPGPAYGRSPADPYFDPFWARVDEARVVVGLHIGESGYNELYSTAWGEAANPSSHRQSAFQWTCFYGDRPIMETIAALVLHNLFGRFPRVRVASVENGSLWVPYLLAALDKMKGMGRNGPWPGGYVEGRPSEVVKRHVYVSPYHEEDIVALAALIGPSQVVFGSDWPHPEGLAEPAQFADGLAALSAADVRRIMRDNTHDLLAP
ncbi:MAG TPA: amidohydrolase family protein [Acidimicrobiales bacterium]|jgi:predicted TIM-barrel fold metal-dependent hydrolase|nr:amidohydrolase family protein [Acidimicrobiales bacterium]